MMDPSYPSLSKAVADSVLWRTGAAAVALLAAAWSSSSAARMVAATRDRFDRPSMAWTITVGGLLCLLLQPAIPAYIRSGLPWFWPLTAIAVAAVCAANVRALEKAWPHSLLARLVTERRPHR